MNSGKENATGLKVKKSRIINALIAAAYAVLIASLIIGTTGARYAETRNVYSDFDAASFNTIILGDLGTSYTDAKSNLVGKNIYAFSEKFNSVDFHPGETRELKFTVANGDLATNASDVDTVYSIKLRTTGNIPVDFYLTHTCTENSITVTKTYRPSTTPTTISTGIEGDSNWYEYSFYEVTGKDNDTGKEILATSQAAFSLPGSNALDLNMHSFVIDWPAPTSAVTTGKATNDASYMKELRLFEVYVSVYSANSKTIRTEIDDSEVPALADDQFYTTGIIYMLDGNDYKLEQVQTRHYPIDYRAFYNTTGDDQTYTSAAFRLILNDGIVTDDSPTQAELDATPYQTEYKIRLKVPVGYVGTSSTENEYSNIGYVYKIMAGDYLLNKLSSTYYLYNINLDSEEQITNVTTDAEAMAYYDDEANAIDHDKCYVYRLDTFSYDGIGEYMQTNTNLTLSPITGSPYRIVGHRDEVTVLIYKSNGEVVKISEIPGDFAATHQIDLQLEYTYTNSRLSQDSNPSAS